MKLNQVELARILETSQSRISKIERGELALLATEWIRFCAIANIRPESLLDDIAPAGECRPPEETDHSQKVYFVQCETTGRIKIGHSKNLKTRLRALRTVSVGPLRLLGSLPGGPHAERSLHRRFSKFNTRLEWFEPAQEIMDFISAEARS